MKLVYTVLVLAALVYAERRLIEPRLTGARLSALVQAALVYKVLVYQEWIHEFVPQPKQPKSWQEHHGPLNRLGAIQVLRNADGGGGGVLFSGEKTLRRCNVQCY